MQRMLSGLCLHAQVGSDWINTLLTPRMTHSLFVVVVVAAAAACPGPVLRKARYVQGRLPPDRAEQDGLGLPAPVSRRPLRRRRRRRPHRPHRPHRPRVLVFPCSHHALCQRLPTAPCARPCRPRAAPTLPKHPTRDTWTLAAQVVLRIGDPCLLPRPGQRGDGRRRLPCLDPPVRGGLAVPALQVTPQMKGRKGGRPVLKSVPFSSLKHRLSLRRCSSRGGGSGECITARAANLDYPQHEMALITSDCCSNHPGGYDSGLLGGAEHEEHEDYSSGHDDDDDGLVETLSQRY